MKCPTCGYTESKVIDSRPSDNASIRRRRECIACGRRFTTYETIDTVPLVVIKKDGRREIFDRNKILTGLVKSAYKRPVKLEELEKLAAEVESELQGRLRGEVASEEVGELVMEKLKQLDEVAYVRFASVYREFKDAETFRQELEKMKSGK
ncbi:MAG: transcriptional repressor NrdR [Clostridiales bacterium]|nr:transcriptional repressor NrdR [Clostridiales bacterium]